MRIDFLSTSRKGLAGAIVVALLAAGCGSTPTPSPSATPTSVPKIGGSVSVWAEWTTTEQTNFLSAIKPFETQSGVTVNYASKGSNTDTAVEASVTGGAPPDVAFLPDPGAMDVLAQSGALLPIKSILGSSASNFSSSWQQLGSYNGQLYGIWFKAANKNTIWYNPAEFKAAGITSTPTTWEQLLADAATLHAAGIPAFSLCTDIGWPVADLWQNLYLKTAGPANYDKLAHHQIAWTDPTVTTAFNTLNQLISHPDYLHGGVNGANYPDCVNPVFPTTGSPSAAMVMEADFVPSQIPASYKAVSGVPSSCNTTSSTCYSFFPFPAPASESSNSNAIQVAGDVAVLLKSTPQSRAFMQYLAQPQGAEIWAHAGGYTSPNLLVPVSAYPNAVLQADARELQTATSSSFSMDDLQGWEHQLWSDMLSYMRNPASLPSIESTMQAQATAAHQT